MKVLSDKDTDIIKVLQQVMTDSLEINEKKQNNLSKEIKIIKRTKCK